MLFRRKLLTQMTTAALLSVFAPRFALAADITVAAAASLKDALEELKPELEKSLPGTKLIITSGGSGTLSQQILQGAPIDLFLSAAAKPMDGLAKENALHKDSRKVFLTNEIVMIAPDKNPSGIKSFSDLKSSKVKRIAIAEPRSVPAGDYATQVLKKLDLDRFLIPKYVFAKDVRQVLAYVERGEVDAGFVYASDLLSKNVGQVKIIDRAPKDSHEPIVYEIAVVTKTKQTEEAKKVWNYLGGKDSEKVWLKYGFTLPSKLKHAAL